MKIELLLLTTLITIYNLMFLLIVSEIWPVNFFTNRFQKKTKKFKFFFERNTESMFRGNWSGIIKIIAGFFTIFAFLTYTLEKVLLKQYTPYYLAFLFFLIVGLYLLLSLYFFYLNRISAYRSSLLNHLLVFTTMDRQEKQDIREESEKVDGVTLL